MVTRGNTEKHSQDAAHRIARAMLVAAAAIFLLFAILFDKFILGLFIDDLDILPRAIPRVREVRVYFILWGIALLLLSEVVKRVTWVKRFLSKRFVMNIFLAALSSTVFIAILEFSLRPFAYLPVQETNVFIKDNLLGWKLRPYANDQWANARVVINGKGLRGPELPYAKQQYRRRILYLGDSVTFGFGIEYEQSFPFLVESILKQTQIDTIETINSGVDGYSPWQEYIYLTREGLLYQPDLVVVSFVLNDVTEKLSLRRFGGWHEGWQLDNTKESRGTLLDLLATRSNILYFTRMLAAKMRFGNDIQLGARKAENLYVGHLAYSPDRPGVQEAWESTFEDLGKIFNACKEHHTPAILVVFPFVFQFDNAETLSTPQRVVGNFARENNIPVIDLLPLLDERMKATGTKPEDYFLDDLHPSPLGSSVVADTVASFIRANRLLSHN